MDTCHCTFVKTVECTTPRMNPNVNCGLWVKMTCQCRFTSYNQGTTSVQDVDTGGGYAYAAANI